MARRPYNPNTKYGRRKMREQAAYNISRYTPEEKEAYNRFTGWVWFVIILLIIIGFFIAAATGNGSGFLKWLSR